MLTSVKTLMCMGIVFLSYLAGTFSRGPWLLPLRLPCAPQQTNQRAAATSADPISQTQDPTDWANVQLDRPEHARGRISRLTAMCRDFPTLVTTGGLRRPVLHIGETCARLCRVEPLHSKRKRRPLPRRVRLDAGSQRPRGGRRQRR